MKKILLIFVTFFSFSDSINSQIQYDVVSSVLVGPGIYHTHYVTPSIPYNIHVLQVDLKNQYVKMKTVKAQNRLVGSEKTSSMASRNSYAGHRVIGAVNADFYGKGGVHINIQIVNGEMLRKPIDVSTIGFDTSNHPSLGIVYYTGTLKTANESRAINNVNATRNTDQLILYNSFQGASTQTNIFGTEVLVTPLTPWIVNDTVICKVDTLVSGVGNMSISIGKAVLSVHGASETFLTANVKKGDTIKIYLGISP